MTSVGEDNPPYELVFEPVLGADVYRLILDGPVREELVFQEYIEGELNVASLVLDSAIPSGAYKLSLEGLGAGGARVGNASAPILVNFVAAVPTAFAPGSDLTLSGQVLASSVDIPAGVTVTADADLAFYSMGPVNVEGRLLGLDGMAPGADGVSLRILTASNLEISGEIQAGHGGSGDDVVEIGNDPALDTEATSGAGGRGGHVVLLTSGDDIVVRDTARVATGDGGSAGEARAEGADAVLLEQDGGLARASGGRGGSGGDLTVFSPWGVLDIAQVAGLLRAGDGGSGGHVTAIGGRGGDAGLGGLAGLGGATETYGGTGGDSGRLFFSTLDWDGSGEVDLAEFDVLGGGIGAEAGASTNLPGLPGKSAQIEGLLPWRKNGPGQQGQPKPVTVAPGAGGGGWKQPGNGRSAHAVGIHGKASQTGGRAVAIGGAGGPVQGLNIGRFQALVFNFMIQAGHGGAATATGGNGGPNGGSGGLAKAAGGPGGGSALNLPVSGGIGGWGFAVGGNGQEPDPCCKPPSKAPDGGRGGDAIAQGGTGGTTIHLGGRGGDASAHGGTGGKGGAGCPPGDGGGIGRGFASTGAPGGGIIPGGNGTELEFDGGQGARGDDCCG